MCGQCTRIPSLKDILQEDILQECESTDLACDLPASHKAITLCQLRIK